MDVRRGLLALIKAEELTRDLYGRFDESDLRDLFYGSDRFIHRGLGHSAMDDLRCISGVQHSYIGGYYVWESVPAAD